LTWIQVLKDDIIGGGKGSLARWTNKGSREGGVCARNAEDVGAGGNDGFSTVGKALSAGDDVATEF
jgi:hypothetical protein